MPTTLASCARVRASCCWAHLGAMMLPMMVPRSQTIGVVQHPHGAVPSFSLVNSWNGATEGTLEVALDMPPDENGNSRTGTICLDSSFTNREASVACAELGLSGGKVVPSPAGSGANAVVSRVACSGRELYLANCTHQVYQECRSRKAVSISCKSALPPLPWRHASARFFAKMTWAGIACMLVRHSLLPPLAFLQCPRSQLSASRVPPGSVAASCKSSLGPNGRPSATLISVR
jgi:hypothetical protein